MKSLKGLSEVMPECRQKLKYRFCEALARLKRV
jgi:hypothetical protein